MQGGFSDYCVSRWFVSLDVMVFRVCFLLSSQAQFQRSIELFGVG